MKKYFTLFGMALLSVCGLVVPAFAQEAGSESSLLGLPSALAIAIPAMGGAWGQAKAVSAALESIGRNPTASGQLFLPMMLGLVFIETLVIFSFVVAFLVLP